MSPHWVKYSVVMFVAALAISIASGLLSYVGVSFPPSLGTIIPTMAAALFEGQRYGQATGTPMDKAVIWRATGSMTLWAMMVQLLLGVVSIIMIGSEDYARMVAVIGPVGWVLILLVMIVLTFVVNRVFFGLGVRQGIKIYEKRTGQA